MRLIAGLEKVDGDLADFLAANAHAFTRADLMATWTRAAMERALREGTVTRLLSGVYSSPQHASQASVRGEALNLWHPAGLVTGALALHLYADSLPVPSGASLRVTNGFRPRAPSWLRTIQGDRQRASCGPSGVKCAVPERALLDAWRFAPASARRNLLYEALWARVCTWRALKRELDRSPRMPGRPELERVLGWFAEGATTPLEVLARHEAFADARFREFEWQAKVRLGHRNARVDMLHRRAGLVVELDGDRYHSTRQARDADRERQTDLAASGFMTIRFGWRDILDRPQWCQERLLRALASRLARPSGT